MIIDSNETVEAVKKNTLELLKSDDDSLVDFITEEYLTQPVIEIDSNSLNRNSSANKSLDGIRMYGRGMSYRRNNQGKFYYQFYAHGDNNVLPTSPGMGCGNNLFTLMQEEYDHYSTGRNCPGGSPIVEFRQK